MSKRCYIICNKKFMMRSAIVLKKVLYLFICIILIHSTYSKSYTKDESSNKIIKNTKIKIMNKNQIKKRLTGIKKKIQDIESYDTSLVSGILINKKYILAIPYKYYDTEINILGTVVLNFDLSYAKNKVIEKGVYDLKWYKNKGLYLVHQENENKFLISKSPFLRPKQGYSINISFNIIKKSFDLNIKFLPKQNTKLKIANDKEKTLYKKPETTTEVEEKNDEEEYSIRTRSIDDSTVVRFEEPHEIILGSKG